VAGACSGDAFDTAGAMGGGGLGAAGDMGMAGANAGGSSQGSGGAVDGSSPDSDAPDLPNPASDALAAEAAATERGPEDASHADASAPNWCAGRQAAFCADFDRVATLTDGWTTANVTPGATLDFDLVAFSSPARSMHAKVPAGTAANSVSASLRKVVSTILSHAVLEFDCNVKTIGPPPGVGDLTIGYLAHNTDEGFGLYVRSATMWTLIVGTGQGLVAAADVPAPPQGRFVHITMDTVWSPSAGSVRIAFDGIDIATRGGLANSLGGMPKTVELAVGPLDASGATPAAEVSIDNVTLQLQ
jgi:hypothetical protein